MSGAYEKATGGIRSVYQDAMAPINTAIATLVGLATTLTASLHLFFNTYLNMEFLTNALKQIKDEIYITIEEAIEIIKTQVFDPVYTIILQIKDEIANVVTNIIDKLKEIVFVIVEKINTLFNTLSDTLYSTGMFIIKNIFYVSFYAFTNFIDKLIPLPVQKTVKVNFVLITFAYIIFLYYTSQIRAFIKEFLAQYYIVFLLLLSFLALYFLFPKREEVLKMSSDAQQVVLPAVSNAIENAIENIDKKETYKNIESKDILPYEYQNQFAKVSF